MGDRPLKEFITKGGTNIKVKAWMTGGEYKQYQSELLKDAEFDGEGKPTGGFKASVLITQQDKLIELMVVQVGDVTDNILEAVNGLPSAEYQELISFLADLTRPEAG